MIHRYRHPDFDGHWVLYDDALQIGWVDPPPSDAFLSEFYRSEYRRKRRESPTPRYIAMMKRRAAAQAELVRQSFDVSQPQTILDIGCGCGTLLAALGQHYPLSTRIGFEPDSIMSASASENVSETTIYSEYFTSESLQGMRFDLICLSHVLEHIPDPEAFFMTLSKRLNPNGRVFVEVPNDPLQAVDAQCRGKVRGLAHLRFFTPSSLVRVIEPLGFKSFDVNTYGDNIIKYWQSRINSSDRSLLKKVFQILNNSVLMANSKVGGFDSAPMEKAAEKDSGMYIRAIFEKSE